MIELGYMKWQRVIDELTATIDKLEIELAVNSQFLDKAFEEQARFPKPKPLTQEELDKEIPPEPADNQNNKRKLRK